MIKLVAFDWNGTIIADVEGIVRANNAVLKHFGFSSISMQQYKSHFQVPIRNYWFSLGLDLEFFDKHAAEQERIFLKYYEPEEKKFRTRSGIKNLLRFLKSRNIESVIFSNHIAPHIEKQLKRLGIQSYFTKVLARPLHGRDHQFIRFKDGFLWDYVRSLKIKPKEVMVVGDTDEEIEIGKKRGYITTALSGGHQVSRRLKVKEPDFLIHNLQELRAIVQKLNKQ